MARDRGGEGLGRPSRLGLFAEMVLVAVLAVLATVLLVPWLAAVAAGVAHLRRHVEGLDDSTRTWFVLLRDALRGGWLPGLVGLLLAGLLAVDVRAVQLGLVPGGQLVVGLLVVVAALVWAVLLRAAALWSNDLGEGEPAGLGQWWQLVRRSALLTLADPVGTVLLVSALAVSVVVVWMLEAMFVLAPGMWALAVTGVEARRRVLAARAS